MPARPLRLDGMDPKTVYNTLLLALPALDASQVTYRREADVTMAVTDEPALTSSGWLSPAEQAWDVVEALGGAVELDAADKRAFGELLADHTEPVETAREIDEPLQPGF